jgi:hypothetical protein
MFNLEQAIAAWRRQMLAAGVKNCSPLDELESHLRDAIEANRKLALPEQLAFESAVAQLGSPTQIRTEFSKNTRPNHKTETAIGAFGIAAYSCMVFYGLFFSEVIEPTTTERIFGLLALAATIAIAIGSRHAWRVLPVIATKRALVQAGVASALVGIAITAVLFLGVLPVIQVTLSQLTVTIVWALLPMLAGGAVLIGLEEAADRRVCRA